MAIDHRCEHVGLKYAISSATRMRLVSNDQLFGREYFWVDLDVSKSFSGLTAWFIRMLRSPASSDRRIDWLDTVRRSPLLLERSLHGCSDSFHDLDLPNCL
jgi:hypothetical protein